MEMTEAQKAELFEDEVVVSRDKHGWILTAGGVWIDTDGRAHFGPGGNGVRRRTEW